MPKLVVKKRGIEEEEKGENKEGTIRNKLVIIGATLILLGLIGSYEFYYAMHNYEAVESYFHTGLSFSDYLWVVIALFVISIMCIPAGLIMLVLEI